MIPGTVKTVEDGVFESCFSLEDAVLENGVQSLGHRVFEDCKSLKGVVIPGSIKSINYQAFNGCVNLKEIQYDGTTSEFKRIIGKNKRCSGVGELVVCCTNGNLTYTQRK